MDAVRKCERCHKQRAESMFYDAFGKPTKTCVVCRTSKRESHIRNDKRIRVGRVDMKTCRKCGQEKPVSAFLPGFTHCRACQRERREQ